MNAWINGTYEEGNNCSKSIIRKVHFIYGGENEKTLFNGW